MPSLTVALLAFVVVLCATSLPLSATQAAPVSNVDGEDDSSKLNEDALRTAILSRYYLEKLNEMAANEYFDDSWVVPLKAEQDDMSQMKRGLGPRPLRFG